MGPPVSSVGRVDESGAVLEREAVRVVLVDRARRVLLIEGHDPAHPEFGWYWFTPGGGREPGESPEQCAVREVLEETGLRLDPSGLGPVLREARVEFGFEGTTIRQQEVFYVVVVEAFEVDTSGWEKSEIRCQREVRWWTADELAATTEMVYPEDLAALVENTIRSGWA